MPPILALALRHVLPVGRGLVLLALACAGMYGGGAIVLAGLRDARALVLGGVGSEHTSAAEREQAADSRSNGNGLRIHETSPEMFVLDVLTQPGKYRDPGHDGFVSCTAGQFTATICDQATVAAAVTKNAVPGLLCATSSAGGV